jgi:uncharacterized protein (TIGR03663 family)
MNRAVFGGVVLAALALALAFRLARADLRPMHHDEANQAVKFGELLETGDYRYDRNDHHGPTLYYLTLPAAWLRGQRTLASLDERTLRAVPAVFGVGLMLLFLPLARGLGRPAVAASAVLAAVSPVLTFYSRFYIQESLFIFFSLGFLIALGRAVERPQAWSAVWAGAFAGLAYATKETSAIVLPVALAAVILARVTTRSDRRDEEASTRSKSSLAAWRVIAAGAGAALLVAFVFYSSFFRYPGGLLESVRAFGIYVGRGIGMGPHVQPFDYYIRLLSYSSSGGLIWSEGAVIVLAVVGLVAAGRSRNGFWPRYVGLYTLIAFVAFSAIRYKTPWNLLPFYVGAVLMAGLGAAALMSGAVPRVARWIIAAALLLAVAHLGVQDWRANFRYPADPRNPYVYAHTVPDFLRLSQRVADVAARHPDRSQMLVKVVAGPYEQWPLPWYLRRMTRVGYWPSAAQAGRLDDAAIVIAAQDQADAVGAELGDRYVQEFYGLRPEVILTVFIEREAWERFMASRTGRP